MGPASEVELRRSVGHQDGDVGKSGESERELVEKGGEEHAVRTRGRSDGRCIGSCVLSYAV